MSEKRTINPNADRNQPPKKKQKLKEEKKNEDKEEKKQKKNEDEEMDISIETKGEIKNDFYGLDKDDAIIKFKGMKPFISLEKRNTFDNLSIDVEDICDALISSNFKEIINNSLNTDVIVWYYCTFKDKIKDSNVWLQALVNLFDSGITGLDLFSDDYETKDDLTNFLKDLSIPILPAKNIASKIFELKDKNIHPISWDNTLIQEYINSLETDFELCISYEGTYSCEPDYIENAMQCIESKESSRKNTLPLVLLAAGSGCGKTRFLYEIWKAYKLKEENVCLFLTFNSDGLNASEYNSNILDAPPESQLAERIFYSFLWFSGYIIDAWENYLSEKKYTFNSIEAVVDLIINKIGGNKKLIVLVDEFLKLPFKNNERVGLMSKMCKLRDKWDNFYFVITSLTSLYWVEDTKCVKNTKTASSRDIVWLTLPKFNAKEIFEDLVIQQIKNSNDEKLKEKYNTFPKQTFEKLKLNICHYCGKHVRSIEYSAIAFVKNLPSCVDYNNLEKIFNKINGATIEKLIGQYTWNAFNFKKTVPLALLGCKIWDLDLNNKSICGIYTSRKLSEIGLISDDLADIKPIRSSSISLIVILSSINNDFPEAVTYFTQLYSQEGNDNTGNSMELLVEGWELCTRFLYSQGITRENLFTKTVGTVQKVSLTSHYRLHEYNCAQYKYDITKRNLDDIFVWEEFLTINLSSNCEDRLFFSDSYKKIKSDPGKDFTCVLKKGDKTLYIPLEVKYSTTDSKKILKSTDIANKIRLLKPVPEFMIFIAFRGITKVPTKQWGNCPVLILDSTWVTNNFSTISPLLKNTFE